MKQVSRPVEQVVAAIQVLDLDPIKLKLMDAEEGQGWSRGYVDRMELAYKRFLTLMVKFPDESIAPTKDVDKFWHGHILDTLKYGEDCQNVFGYFLHHFPYFGMRGEEDAANLRAASANMHAIYEREFGEALPSAAAFCTAAKNLAQSDSAFCTAGAAFCTASAAFCTAAKPSAKSDSAFCTAGAAFCTASVAFCTAAKPSAKSDSAFCTAGAAFCTVAKPGQRKLNVNLRPSLPPAG
jgi:hypothetical protein